MRPVSCQGLLFLPFMLGDGSLLTSDNSLNDLFADVRAAFSRHNGHEMSSLAALLLRLNGQRPNGCAGVNAGEADPHNNEQ